MLTSGIFADLTPPLGLQTVTYRTDRLVLVVPAGHPARVHSRSALRRRALKRRQPSGHHELALAPGLGARHLGTSGAQHRLRNPLARLLQ